MISINVGVFGLLAHWHVNLDPITMCTTLYLYASRCNAMNILPCRMSIGFSVDFTARNASPSQNM